MENSTTCAIDGCGRARRTRDMCSMHYQRVMKKGSPSPPRAAPAGGRPYRDPNECRVDGCDQQERRAGLCGAHHQRLRAHGDLDFVTPRPVQNGVLACSVEGCGKLSKVGGRSGRLLCAMHYSRLQRYGDPLALPKKACAICGSPFAKTGNRQRCCSAQCRKELVAQAGYQKRRRGSVQQATVEKFSRLEIFLRDEWICHLCGEQMASTREPTRKRRILAAIPERTTGSAS